ncbi:class I SAM-dependent methyltransferase [Candidatus Parcubacteria bacterium]|nr:class I SAM-dependent methyltransferase [Candidatus Parcubacteria bacterium]MBT7228170.1 class I SAM-dependent methyltransferase [Candidatus Parcubacteria bacterium]
MWGKDIKTILDLADVKKDDKVYDLGCGDGKVVFAAADRGAKAEGLEISVLPYLIANARKIISRNKAKISFKDFWMTDLSDADLVYFFLIPRIYPKLKTKLEKDLKPGAKVIAYVWPIEGWEPTKVEKREKGPAIYLYEIK